MIPIKCCILAPNNPGVGGSRYLSPVHSGNPQYQQPLPLPVYPCTREGGLQSVDAVCCMWTWSANCRHCRHVVDAKCQHLGNFGPSPLKNRFPTSWRSRSAVRGHHSLDAPFCRNQQQQPATSLVYGLSAGGGGGFLGWLTGVRHLIVSAVHSTRAFPRSPRSPTALSTVVPP